MRAYSQVPPRPPPQAAPRMDGRPTPRRHLPVDDPIRTDLRHRTHPIPHLATRRREPGRREAPGCALLRAAEAAAFCGEAEEGDGPAEGLPNGITGELGASRP